MTAPSIRHLFTTPAGPAPEQPPPVNPDADPPAWLDLFRERAAIQQYDSGLSPLEAEAAAALAHVPAADLEAAAGADWLTIRDDQPARAALALLLATSALRAHGERPAHYIRPVLCECGPVWLWPDAPARVLACPWCQDPPPAGVTIPRPPVRCGRCAHYDAPPDTDPNTPGACAINAPAANGGPPLHPDTRRLCDQWHPREAAPGRPGGGNLFAPKSRPARESGR